MKEMLQIRVFEFIQPEWKAYSGFRYAEDRIDADVYESQHLIAGGQRQYMDSRLLLSARGENQY